MPREKHCDAAAGAANATATRFALKTGNLGLVCLRQ
jgi:hypothetical protein